MTIKHLFPVAKPTLDLNFAAERTLDPLITFSRSSTGTYTDKNGIIQYAAEDEPRFDYDPVTGESLGLLIEESRVNYVQNSIDFNAGDWEFKDSGTAPAAPTCTPNSGTAPDGTNTATRLQCALGGGTTGGDLCYLRSYRDSSTRAVASVWMKSNTGADQTVYSTITELDVTATNVVTSKWRRFAGTSSDWRVGARGDKSDQNIDILIWGAQVEDGDQATGFNTSYIPTSGSAVTRAPDNCTIEGTDFSSWYNQTEGSFTYDVNVFSGLAGIAELRVGTNSGSRGQFTRRNSQYRMTLNGGSAQVNGQISYPNGFAKLAYRMQPGDHQQVINGAIGNSYAGGNFGGPIPLYNKMWIGLSENLTEYLNGHIARISYYPRRLSDEQLQALTA